MSTIIDEDEEVEREREEDLSDPLDYTITSYGADFPVDGLVKRMREGAIFVPKFQRKYVWTLPKASRFIESLLMGLPVPAIFMSRDPDTQKLLVIDGQQRLTSLYGFYTGVFDPDGIKKPFALESVNPRLKGMTYATLKDEDRRRLDDSLIHAIIVRQEEPGPGQDSSETPSSIYHIFERLNTGGVLLYPQEIRACIYQGPLMDLLASLNESAAWRDLFGKPHPRKRDEESILRFFALDRAEEHYTKPMADFLNRFAKRHRSISDSDSDSWRHQFTTVTTAIRNHLGEKALRPSAAFNAAFCDAILVGVARRHQSPGFDEISTAKWKRAYDNLLKDNEFYEAFTTGTTQEDKVKLRLRKAIAAFGKLK